MYKFIFERITDPLGLPVSVIWEYVILLVINEIAFRIAWNASPGGKWGSEIHWAVRIPTFIVLWGITYGVIYMVKWLWINWVLLLIILGAIVAFAGSLTIIILSVKKNRSRVKKR
jgi:hypothetical protein